MFGDNRDIPAFRWYDKDEQEWFVSGKDASLLDARFARGHGLMRGGSSINNLPACDGEKSILTASNFETGTTEEKKRRADGIRFDLQRVRVRASTTRARDVPAGR
jgi:hypothetical protein